MERAKPNYLPAERAWLDRVREDALWPEWTVVDSHHHLWERPAAQYLLPEFTRDLAAGHAIRATIHVECASRHLSTGPVELRPVGETQFVVELAKQYRGQTRFCAGIIGYADLRLGERVDAVLEAHIAAGEGRFKGIRQPAGWDASDAVSNSFPDPGAALFADSSFHAGFARLVPHGLSFDAWVYHPQLPDVGELARKFPRTQIILDHVGGPLGIGPYRGRHDDVFAWWQRQIAKLAQHENLAVKLGGLGMRIGMFDFHRGDAPPSSAELADAWGPYIHECIEHFGPSRCMFESNSPVDQATCSYGTIWNALKRLAARYSEEERSLLLGGTAERIYRLAQ